MWLHVCASSSFLQGWLGDALVESNATARCARAYATSEATRIPSELGEGDDRDDDKPNQLKMPCLICNGYAMVRARSTYLRDEEDEEYGVVDPLLGLEPLSFVRVLLVSTIASTTLAVASLAVLALTIGRLPVRRRVDRGGTGSRAVHGLVLGWRRGLPAHCKSSMDCTPPRVLNIGYTSVKGSVGGGKPERH